MTAPERRAPPLIVWWIIWFAIAAAVMVVYAMVPVSTHNAFDGMLRYLPAVPLVISSMVRWLVLPRFNDGARALPIFVVGLALAEGSAILGMFLVPSLRSEYFALGLVGVAQFVPLFAGRSQRAVHQRRYRRFGRYVARPQSRIAGPQRWSSQRSAGLGWWNAEIPGASRKKTLTFANALFRTNRRTRECR